jgi:hypothetical protein
MFTYKRGNGLIMLKRNLITIIIIIGIIIIGAPYA